MAHLIQFTTNLFNPRDEPPNPVNPIAGAGVLRWLQRQLADTQCEIGEPDYEDWGWFMDVRLDEAFYLVGASGEPEHETERIDWTLQIERHRSLREKLLGKNAMGPDDPLTNLVESVVRGEPAITSIDIDRSA